MRSLRLTDFRSFADTGRNELAPITVLVGSNSSGKSSYLRFFPLLRQTAEKPTRSPLLWFGDFVDFGEFQKTVRRGNSSLSFEFDVTIPAARKMGSYRRHDVEDIDVSVSVTMAAIESQTYVSMLHIRCGEDLCKLAFSDAGELTEFFSNNIDVMPIAKTMPWRVVMAPFVPLMAVEFDPRVDMRHTPIKRALADYLKEFAHNRTKDTTLLGYANYLYYGQPQSMLSTVKRFELRHLPSPSSKGATFRHIRSLVLAKDVGDILGRIQGALASFAAGVTYLGPFRRDPARFYRQQELSVEQIEPHGENLAMFLRSLSKEQIADLSDFVLEYLGFSVSVDKDGNHIAIVVGDGVGKEHNLIDMGYGISQVLPVIAQCWLTAQNIRMSPRNRATTVLAIEQPELHLHPSHQAKLADMFSAVLSRIRSRYLPAQRQLAFDANDPDFGLRILIETHSEAMVNRFGELIESGALQPADVKVLLFEKDGKSGISTIREATYSKDGTLENWPIGFFAP